MTPELRHAAFRQIEPRHRGGRRAPSRGDSRFLPRQGDRLRANEGLLPISATGSPHRA